MTRPAPRDWCGLDPNRPTGRTRIRNTWFGFAVFEEEVEFQDGRREWRKVTGHRLLHEGGFFGG